MAKKQFNKKVGQPAPGSSPKGKISKTGKAKVDPKKVQAGVKKGLEVADKVIKVATDPLVQDILAGIFNDDNDYVFNGYMPEIPMNDKRPMDYMTLSQFISQVYMGGVPSISRLNMSFDISKLIGSDLMRISADRVLATLRESLRSNLIENSLDISNYLLAVVSLQTMVAQYKRAIYTASVTNGTEVQFNRVINSVGDPYVLDFHAAMRPAWTDPSSSIYAENLNLLPLVEAALNRLIVPKKYKNWINWYFNTVFIDQKGLHKQWYVNDLRSVSRVSITGDLGRSQLLVDGSIDFFAQENPLEYIYNFAVNLYSVFAVLIADITKSDLVNRFEVMTMGSETRVIDDPSYFQYLVNTYATSSGNWKYFSGIAYFLPYAMREYSSGSSKTGYIRYDTIEGVPTNKLGPIQGLVNVATPLGADYPTLIQPLSQSAVVYLPDGMKTHTFEPLVTSSENALTNKSLSEGCYCLSMYSFVYGESSLSLKQDSAITLRGTTESPIPATAAEGYNTVAIFGSTIYGTPLSGGNIISVAVDNIGNANEMLIPYKLPIATLSGKYTGTVYVKGGFSIVPNTLIYDNAWHSTKDYSLKSFGDTNIELPTGEPVYFSSTPEGNFGIKYRAYKTGSLSAVVQLELIGNGGGGGNYTLPISNEMVRALFVKDDSVGVNYLGTAWNYWTIQADVPEGTSIGYFTNSNAANIHFISDRFDYAIPVYYMDVTQISANVLINYSNVGLIKETYTPTLLELNSVYVVLKQMFLGLMSII